VARHGGKPSDPRPFSRDALARRRRGTLYGIIKRLLADGWIRESALGSTERRRAYRLTPAGRKVALAEAERLRDLVLSAQSKKLLTSEI
jgi:DNA-binding PadR family transcriptional regulator